MIGFVIGLAVAVAGACLFDSMSKDERQRQQRLENNYKEYKTASDAEYSRILHDRKSKLKSMQRQTAQELWLARQQAIEDRKSRNQRNFDILMEEWNGQYSDRKSLLAQIEKTIGEIKKASKSQQATELRSNSFEIIMRDAYEALARQKAYQRYLNRYKKSAEILFDHTGELLDPFQMTLPEFWAYRGKIIAFDRTDLLSREFEKSIHNRVDCKFFCEDSSKIDELFPDEEIIYCLVESFDGNTYVNKVSVVKGMFIHKLELSPNLQLDSKVKHHEQNEHGFLTRYILDFDCVEMTLNSNDCQNRRLSPIGSRRYVYVTKFERKTLEWVYVTERIEDCLTSERFRNVPLLIRSCDYQNFIDMVRKRNVANSYDEWYLSPIVNDEDLSDIRYKCQLGQKLIFLASFIESEHHIPILLFEKFLPDEEMLAADDVFVSLDASLKTRYLEEISNIPQEYLQESRNLFIYTSAEFSKQRRIQFNRKNALFLDQWTAIMHRLIQVKESGGSVSIEVEEQLNDKTFLTSQSNKLRDFYILQARKHDAEPAFFIRDTNDKKMQVASFDDDFKIVTMREALNENFLENAQYSVEIHVQENPYPERMQLFALEDFRRSRIKTPTLKETILDLSHMSFKDSGQRPKSIKNSSILQNKSQLLAVIRSVATKDFFMIQGPPGTGKTTVIKEIIWQQLNLKPESKILIVSQANVAVDNVLRGLPNLGISIENIVRCGNDEKISDEMKQLSLDKQIASYTDKLSGSCENLQYYREIWKSMMKNPDTQRLVGEYMLKNFSVIGATCVGLAKKHYGLDKLSFDLAIVDESGKALPGELILPINRAKKVIIIGDHKQLPPVIDPAFFDDTKINISDIVDDEDRNQFFETSLFEKLYEDCPNDNKCMLNVQFRMPTMIGKMVSDLFYNGQLHSDSICDEKYPLCFDKNIFFLNMDDDPTYHEQQDNTEYGKTGPYNVREIEIAVTLIKKIREKFSDRIAVITPYKNQNKKLRRSLRGEHLKNVVVNTIDAFQGDEADIVIYCTTRSQKPTIYFSDAARINVAFSRARNLLILIGALKYFRKYEQGHLMQQIADYLENNAQIVNSKNFFAEEFQMNFSTSQSVETFSENLNQTSLTTHEIEEYLPKKIEDSLVACRCCGRKFKPEELIEGFCSYCLLDGEHYKCQHCKTTDMLYTNAAKYIDHLPKEELCSDCKIVWQHKCHRCGVGEVIVRVRDVKNHPDKTEDDFPYCPDCRKFLNQEISVTCDACHGEFSIRRGKLEDLQNHGKSLYCQSCLTQEISIGTCKSCQRPILSTHANIHKLDSAGKSRPKYCSECRKRRSEAVFVTCSCCGKSFSDNRGHIEDLRNQRKSIYCHECLKPKPIGTCRVCGGQILMTPAALQDLRERFGSNYAPPKKHKNCR